ISLESLTNFPFKFGAEKSIYFFPTLILSIAFINTLLEAYPEIEPEEFDICPMLLAHPEKDLWTPVEISELFFNRLHKINKQLVILENAGHFPIESPGLQLLEESILGFIGELN
ncbi:MAG: hypothetical protein ACQES4_10460, partial [Bacillota bacterium]